MDNLEKSRAHIEKYLGKTLRAELDGVVFDDQPNTFAFRFVDPEELRAAIVEMHTDEMEMTPWCDLLPVAAVSVPERGADEFAWVFLDWREVSERPQTRFNREELEWMPIDWGKGEQPSVLVATHDNWGSGGNFLSANSLESLLGTK
jgi:hypothetical protein